MTTTKIPEEVDARYQFIDEEAYRVITDPSPEVIEISGHQRICHRLRSVSAGKKDEAIDRFLKQSAERPAEVVVEKPAKKGLKKSAVAAVRRSVRHKARVLTDNVRKPTKTAKKRAGGRQGKLI